jgi:hypothetical protein
MNTRTLAILCALVLGAIVILGISIITHTPPEPAPAPVPTPAPAVAPETPTPTSTQSVIGTSVEGRPIEVFTFGTGDTPVLFVGGIHGGYEWNSIELAYEMIDHFSSLPESPYQDLTIHIVPNLNPDGLHLATGLEGRFTAADIPNNDMHETGLGRFNANNVDLNRNFACKWAPESSWRGQTVSAGTAPFSEPEAATLRDYVVAIEPVAAVFWHSRANNVYASECEEGVLPDTLTIMNLYATAGSYGAVPVFDAYPVTGDAEGWLASLNIPAILEHLQTTASNQ